MAILMGILATENGWFT